MFCRWAAVSLTLLAVTVAGLLSTLELQPPPHSTAVTAATAAACADTSNKRGARHERSALLAMIVCGEILPMPPAAAQRLKKRCRVGIAARLSLYQADARLLVGLLGAEQREETRITGLPLTLGEVQRRFGGIGCGGGCLQLFGVFGERGESVGDILAGGQNGAAILRSRLRVAGSRGALLVQQCPALEDGCGQIGPQRPEPGAGGEQLIDGERRAARGGAQGNVGQAVCHGYADLGAGVVQVSFRLAHVRTLGDEVRGY